MRRLLLLTIGVLGLTAHAGLAQMPKMPSMPSASEMATMSPEELRQWADNMMIEMGESMGIDPEVMRNASDAERERLLEEAGERMEREMRANLEAQTGMTYEELEALSDEEAEALSRRLFMPKPREWQPLPLAPTPPSGFADGATPLLVGEDRTAQIAFEDSAEDEVILVVVDSFARQILWQENLQLPLSQNFAIDDFRTDPSVLIFEVISTDTHRVKARFRPVSME